MRVCDAGPFVYNPNCIIHFARVSCVRVVAGDYGLRKLSTSVGGLNFARAGP